MNDPLAQFRRKPAAAAGMSGTGQTPPPKSPDGYVAFDTKDRVARLKIFKKNYPTHTPGYHYLLDVVYSGQNVTQIGMGTTWWEKSITFMSRIREQAATVIKNSWRRFLDHPRDGKDEPDISM